MHPHQHNVSESGAQVTPVNFMLQVKMRDVRGIYSNGLMLTQLKPHYNILTLKAVIKNLKGCDAFMVMTFTGYSNSSFS